MKKFLALLFFLIPLVWTQYVNAHYLTTKTFFMYFLSGLCFMALPDDLNFRKIPRVLVVLLGAILVYQFGYYFVDFKWYNLYFAFKVLSLISITLYIYSLNLKLESLFEKITWFFLAMWMTLIFVTAKEIFIFRVLQENIKTDIILSLFGNINMLAEFLILSVPFVFLWTRYEQDRIPRWIKLSVLFFVSFFIFYGRSRSAWLGLAGWFVFAAIKDLKKGEYVALASALVLFLVSHFTAPDVSRISKFVPESFSERSSLYLGSLELLRDKPFGIELGHFMDEIVPYLIDKKTGPNEFAYFDQPHSEFLKWGIQFGWVYLGLCILFFAALSWELLKNYKETIRANDKPQVLGRFFFIQFFICLFPQMCFQFPFENPASIVLISIAFGLFLSSYAEGIQLRLKYLQYLWCTIGFVCILNSVIYFTFVHFESAYYRSEDLMKVVCFYNPTAFKACNWKNKALLTKKNIPPFRAEFMNDYKDHPLYCENLRLLVEYYNNGGPNERNKTCEALMLYKQIFRQQQVFAPEAFAACSGYKSPVNFESGGQFATDFRKWLSQ